MKYIPVNTTEVCSPFFGGGSMEIAMVRTGIKVYGYDIFNPLVCFWRAVQEDRDRLLSIIEKYFPLPKEKFYTLQKDILNETDNTTIGAMFFVLNRCSFSGMGMSGGMSPNHPRFTQRQIDSVNKFSDIFSVKDMSFDRSIAMHDCLVFADPPYLIDQALYGNAGDTHKGFNHVLLAKILNDRGNFLLCYNDCEEIKDMYSDHNFHYPEWKYGLGKDKNSREILITSKDLKLN